MRTLKDRFGFDGFLKGQREVIDRIMAGQSAAAIFPTGAGKSLCYQLPALHLQGLTLVVSPLLSLMKDQLAFLRSKEIPAAKLDSGMERQEYHDTLQDALKGRLKILIISVERFKNERFRLQLGRMRVSLLAVDEAHCISEWGHNFRPDYLKIPIFQKEFNIPQVLLLTATATPRVTDDMARRFAIPKENVFSTGFYRKNLMLRVVPALDEHKQKILVKTLSEPPAGPAIVYVTLQKTAEKVATMLVSDGFDARPYHAGLKPAEREEIQNLFMSGKAGIIVATIAFGMGIDKRDIRKVIHYDLPKSIENYSQEIGRSGRDGELSVCTVIGNRNGVPVLENFAYGDRPELSGIRQVLATIKECPGREMKVRLYELSGESDIRILPLKTLLVYLEIKGILKPKFTYFENYPFKFVRPPEEIAANFDGQRRQFVSTLFRFSETAKVWTTPDIDAISAESQSKRERVLAALEYFDGKGWIELQPKSGVEVFEVLRPDFDVEETAGWLARLFADKEANEVRRIHRMIRLFETAPCLAVGLSGYFGEKIENPCGRCSSCRTGKPTRLPAARLPSLSTFDFNRIMNPFRDSVPPPHSVDLVTRFFCGIITPRLARSRVKKLSGFGMLGTYPYQKVAEWVAEHEKKGSRNQGVGGSRG